ncbi:MAG TPA: NUDIX domain-containing protein [Gemmatimonadales bacterium]|nr:NUDIX domain-containing protein [Gemmatimonadales bacterium]
MCAPGLPERLRPPGRAPEMPPPGAADGGLDGEPSMTTFPCARCGAPLRHVRPLRGPRHGGPLEIRCPRCRFLMFDYPRPCAGMLVLKGRSLLVLRRGHHPRRGYLDTPGGFIDAGEDIEEAARRELLEETGLSVGRLRWFGFYWDRYFLRGFGYFPTMNFYYLARWRSGEPKAADDAASVEWMPIERIGRARARFAWRHMHAVVRDLRRLVR